MRRFDRVIDDCTSRQNGVVGRRQLIAAGIERRAIKRRLDSGQLYEVFHGVYAQRGSPLPELGPATAAVLACAPKALLTHLASLAVWDMLPPPPGAPVDVTVIGRQCAQRAGIRLHRLPSLDGRDMTRHRGLPVSTPARALLESAVLLPVRELERALDEGIAQGLVTRPQVLEVIERYPRARGAATLRELADPQRASQLTQREAEERLLVLLRRADAPPSVTHLKIGRWEADRAWPEQRVVVEVDGGRFHRDRKRFERDHRKDADLRAAGWIVLRFTARQVLHEPEYVLFRLGQALAVTPLPVAA